jgi:methyl-accepting chemotaxis protein
MILLGIIMVFGFGKKKPAKEAEMTTTQERQITLAEISQILKEREHERFSTVLEKAKPIREQIEAERKNIIRIVSDLEKDDLETDDIDKRLKVIVEQGKKAAISGLRKETSINLSKLEKYSDIADLNSETGQLLKRMGDVLGKNSKVLHVFARKYADKLKEHISVIARSKSNLQKIVDDHTSFETASTKILELAEKIKNIKEQIEQKKHSMDEVKKNIEKQSETIHKIKQSIDDLKSKTEYQEFLKIKKEIESLGPEKNRIKLEIDTQFSKISRPLGKYIYVSSLDKPLKKIMEELVAEPIDVIKNENKDAIVQILQSVVKGVVSGNVSVKDTQKSIEQIEETIQKLEEFIQAKEKFSQKLALLENKLTIFDIKNLEENEKLLSKISDDKSHDESKISLLEEEIEENTKLMPQIASEIKNKLENILLTKISLKIQD